jgi:hypothetical protein
MNLLFKNKIRLLFKTSFKIMISLKKLTSKISHSILIKLMKLIYKKILKIKKQNKQWNLFKEWILLVLQLLRLELTKWLKRMMKIFYKMKIKKYLNFLILLNWKKKIHLLSKSKQTICRQKINRQISDEYNKKFEWSCHWC